MENNKIEYKNLYTGIFSLNYFTQGVNSGMFISVVPIYILITYGTLDPAAIAFMVSIILIPATIKLIYGLLSDKISFKKLGRRKPWIILPASLSGIVWLIIPFLLPSTAADAIRLFTIGGLFIAFGMFMSDTATDGFILDICPKEQLGRTQGFCWSLRAIGIITGGPIVLLTLLFLPIEFLFICLAIVIIFSSMLTLFIPDIKNPKDVDVIANLKLIFRRSENWKVFLFSFFIMIGAGVTNIFVSLYILIEAGLVNPTGATLNSLEDVSLYEYQALLTLIFSLGIFAGSIIGGIFTDKKSRRIAVLLSIFFISTSILLLLIPVPVILLLIFSAIVGFSNGWGFSSYTAIASEYSQQYPEMDSTYYSICVSFVNFGTLVGLILAVIVFSTVSRTTTDIREIYGILFIFTSIISILALIPFLMLDRDQYEIN